MTTPIHGAIGMSCHCDPRTMQEANSDLCASLPTCYFCEQQGGLLWTRPAEAAALPVKSLLHSEGWHAFLLRQYAEYKQLTAPKVSRLVQILCTFTTPMGSVPVPLLTTNVLQVRGTCSANAGLWQHTVLYSTR